SLMIITEVSVASRQSRIRQGEAGVLFDRSPEIIHGLLRRVHTVFVKPALEIEIVRLQVARRWMHQRSVRPNIAVHAFHDSTRHFLLNREHIRQIAVPHLRPVLVSVARAVELSSDAKPAALTANAALEYRANI